MTIPALDGHVKIDTISGMNVATVVLTTTNSPDVICVVAYAEKAGGAPTVTGVAATGLTFARRAISNASGAGCLELWWALASTPLTSASLAVTWSAAFDDCAVVAFTADSQFEY
jgi:hypothetical protein